MSTKALLLAFAACAFADSAMDVSEADSLLRGSSPPGGGQEVNASAEFRRTQQGEFTVCTNQGRGGSGRNNAQWLCAAFDDACTCTEACAIGSTIGYYARVVKCQNEDNPGACQADRPSRTSMGASSGELEAEGKSKSCPCTNCAAALEIDGASSLTSASTTAVGVLVLALTLARP